ncbi:hypothetical protein BI334_06690 [Moorena producens 3L]|nr:hypothetical protein BI334_06690 [Moorena producens 3L]
MVTDKNIINSIFWVNSHKSHPKSVFLFKVSGKFVDFEQKSKSDLRTQPECRVLSNRPWITRPIIENKLGLLIITRVILDF